MTFSIANKDPISELELNSSIESELDFFTEQNKLKREDFYDYYNNHTMCEIPRQVITIYSAAISLVENQLGIKLYQYQKEMIFNIICSRKGIVKK